MIQTRRGARVRVLEDGPADARPVVFLHGLSGLLADERFLDTLARRFRVFAPELPGYGDSTGEDLLEDMLDFSLHGWDVIGALGLRLGPGQQGPAIIGHSIGGMIAAEMACLAPEALSKLVLIDAFGLWLDEQPIPDIFAFLPFEFGEYLFFDADQASSLLAGGTDLADLETLREFFVGNARRLGTAGKILFPIPNRRLSKRLYRLVTDTLVVWGEQDRLMPPVYASRWADLLPRGRVVCVPKAGHMLPYEQPAALAREVDAFLRQE
jgi:pimeloyl-ACP methyl ester carboxylesterase